MKYLNNNYCVLGIFLLLITAPFPGCRRLFDVLVNGKEVEVTDEWYLLQDGETIPAGAHIKMDMSTGEKWVKKLSSSEENRDMEEHHVIEVGSDGSTKRIKTTSSSSTAVMETPGKNTRSDDDEVMMMYRVLSKLPPDEIGDDGTVLPHLPTSQDERSVFESQVRAIWDRRQKILVTLSQSSDEEDGASNASGMLQLQLPKLLNRYIRRLRSFLAQRYAACYESQQREAPSELTDFNDVLFVLSELEYHLSDIDAARDFHTLGGWPVLGFLLSSPSWLWEYGCATIQSKIHHNNSSDNIIIRNGDEEQQNREREELQTAVAWALGNAVKNHAEFALWPLEPIPSNPLLLFGNNTALYSSSAKLLQNSPSATNHEVNVISLLLGIIQEKSSLEEDPNSSVLPKAVYAIAAILRGNPYAQLYFLKMGGSLILGNNLEAALSSNNLKLVKKVLSLAHDILLEVTSQQHGNDGFGQLPSSVLLDQQQQKLVIRGFTGKQWCQSAFQILEIQYLKQHRPSEVEAVLRIIEPMIPHCQDAFQKEVVKVIIQKLKSRWSSSEVDDDEWRQELLELVGSIENKLHYTS